MKNNLDDMLYQTMQINLTEDLYKNKLFVEFEIFIGRILNLIIDEKIKYTSDSGGDLSYDAIHKIMDESAGFLGCLKQGCFYASLNHARALLELLITLKYAFSEAGKNKGIVNLYPKYRHLRRHIMYLESLKETSVLPEDQKEFLSNNYSTLDSDILATFQYKSIKEAIDESKRSSSWIPKRIISFMELIESADPIHSSTYEQLCNYTHFSPMPNRSKRTPFGLPQWWEDMLRNTALYSYQSYLEISNSEFISSDSKLQMEAARRNFELVLFDKVQQSKKSKKAATSPEPQSSKAPSECSPDGNHI